MMWVKVIAKKKSQRNIRRIIPINGPAGVICVGETALILDGSLKGSSKLCEVRHPVLQRKREIYCSIQGKVPPTMGLFAWNESRRGESDC